MSCLVVSPIRHYRHQKIEFMKMKNFRRKLERERKWNFHWIFHREKAFSGWWTLNIFIRKRNKMNKIKIEIIFCDASKKKTTNKTLKRESKIKLFCKRDDTFVVVDDKLMSRLLHRRRASNSHTCLVMTSRFVRQKSIVYVVVRRNSSLCSCSSSWRAPEKLFLKNIHYLSL